MSRGRKSAAELEVVTIDVARKPLEPPKELNAKQRAIFAEIVASVPPQHFRKGDIPLLTSLATATALARFYAAQIGENESAFKQWTEATKLQISLATKLRLTPQSRTDSRAAGREREPLSNPPWEC